MSDLTNSMIKAEWAYADVEAKMDALRAATRHGNIDRIGNAAHDAELAALALAATLSTTFDVAARLSADRYEASAQFAEINQ